MGCVTTRTRKTWLEHGDAEGAMGVLDNNHLVIRGLQLSAAQFRALRSHSALCSCNVSPDA